MPFGEVRTEVGTISQTDFGFTGQRSISMLSIMDYIARNYDPAIGRFVQPDTIVPNPANPQSWNRYSYVMNNPIMYSDPSGHSWEDCNKKMNSYQCRIHRRQVHRLMAEWERNAIQESFNIDNGSEGTSTVLITPPTNSGYECTPIHPCIGPWEIPSDWDLDPFHPDYHSLVVSVYSFTVELTEDRYGQKYIAVGGTANIKSFYPFSVAVVEGSIGSASDQNIPGNASTYEFLTGPSVNLSGGFLGGGGITFSPVVFFHWVKYVPDLYGFNNYSVDSSPLSLETRFYVPQLGITGTWGWAIP